MRAATTVPWITENSLHVCEPSCAYAGTMSHLFANPVSNIDWNVELRKITREYDGLPPEPPRPQKRRSSKTEIRLERIEAIATKYRFYDRLSVIGVWVRLILVASLMLALFWWPYGRSGVPLVAFLISNAMAILGGASLAVRTWRDRMVWPFVGALLVVAVAWTVIALHTLPRLGYSPAAETTSGWGRPPNR